MRFAVLPAFLVLVLAPSAVHAAGSRLSEFGPYLVPASASEVDRLRATKAAVKPESPEARIESAVRDRVALLSRALSGRSRRIVLDTSEAYSSPGLPVDEFGRLHVRITGVDASGHLADLTALGVLPTAVAAAYDFLEAWVPYGSVHGVASLPWVRLVGQAGLPVPEIGSELTEGDAIHRADLARTTFGIDGTGATVGIISDGVSNLVASQALADLPGGVSVGVVGTGDEGTAMLEIVHDLAPGAGLAFHTAGGGSAGMITAQNWLVATGGATIVCDDIWLPREPYFQDGPVALNAANLVTTNGIVYFTSAGNRATRHIPQAYRDGGAQAIGAIGNYRPHDFSGAGDFTADIRLRNPSGTGVRHILVLQWNEAFGAAARDFDLYLVNGGLTSILQTSTNVQNGAGDPFEYIDFTYNGADNAPARILVDYAGPLPVPAGITLKIASNGPTFLEYVNPAGSINPHARHPLVYALGAIDQADFGNDTPEPFSSRGPADMLVPAADNRNKPDAAAIDGVQVTGVGGFPSPFFGTSAAAPHAAGIAALLRGAVPALTSAEVRQALSDNAVDLGAPGFDFNTGAGRLDAFRTVDDFLNQPPVADAGDDQTVECTGSAGTPVTLDGTGSSDPDGDALTYAWTAPGIVFDDPASPTPTGTFPLGSTIVTLTVSDAIVSDSDEVVITIEDTTPPSVAVSLDPATLWPPNHKLAEITADLVVADVCDANPVVRLLSIVSNEPDNGQGDGDAPNDIQEAEYGTDDRHFRLRSERQGPEPGRVYTVCYEAEDASGNVGTGCATVTVTHDQSAAALFLPISPESSPWVDGGWIELSSDATLSVEELAGAPPVLGSDVFERVDLGASAGLTSEVVVGDEPDGNLPAAGEGTSEAPRVRWFVPAEVVQSVLTGAETATVFARVVIDGAGFLASAPVPGVPPAALRPSGFAGSATGGTGAAGASGEGAAPAGTSHDATTPAPAPRHLSLVAVQPVRAGGTITFGLPVAGTARVRLLCATGRSVALLADGQREAGWHRATVPGRLDPGLYFVLLEMGGRRSAAKVVVVP